ncbi:MAG: M3 family oligoendopeptidase [Spirochaetaceae bacterium]|nr:MAG: M3 family oligoendopeptidase [Spirochaetaceae bacterium]
MSRLQARKELPVWNLDVVYPGTASEEYASDLTECRKQANAIADLAKNIPRSDGEKIGWLKQYIRLCNSFSDIFENLYSWVYMRFSVNTEDYDAVNQMNLLDEIKIPAKTSLLEFRQVITSLERSIAECFLLEPELKQHSFFIHEQILLKSRQMSRPEEELAEELLRTGGDMWGRLQEAMSSSLQASWPGKGKKTVTELRGLAFDPDRAVRKKAFELELAAWETAKVPLSFAINGVKGFSVVLDRRRKYRDTLDRSILQARMSEKALTTLIASMKSSLTDFRRYLAAKAKILHLPKLAFFDLFAPVSKSGKAWSFPQAQKFIISRFGDFSEKLAGFAKNAFASGWVDAKPRKGKVGGAYCISLPEKKESRVLCNFNDTFGAVTTVAHELGHAFHHHVLAEETSLLRDYPMTLAETASIFSENIIFEGALDTFPRQEKTSALEHFLQDSTQIIVDILSRYIFESKLLEERVKQELSPELLCKLMKEAQMETYGDALDEKYLHPYMWAVKSHYYRSELAFYNFPYAFGLLFGLALVAQYREQGKGFAAEYERILSLTGRMTCVDLAKEIGLDIESESFWQKGLDVIRKRIDEFCKIAESGMTGVAKKAVAKKMAKKKPVATKKPAHKK